MAGGLGGQPGRAGGLEGVDVGLVGEGDADVVESVEVAVAGWRRRAGTARRARSTAPRRCAARRRRRSSWPGRPRWRPRAARRRPRASTTGTSPFLVQLLRKMSEKHGAITASKPYCWIAHTACSRDDPTPNADPATSTLAPAKRSSLSTKSRSSRHVANRPFSNPVRSMRFSQSAGMIWSVSTSERRSGSPVPEMTCTASCVPCMQRVPFSAALVAARSRSQSQILRGGEVAGDGRGGGDGG